MTLNKDRSKKSVAFATALLAVALSVGAGTVAVAQTPSPGTTPGATGTGTAQVTGTGTGTALATGTAQTTGTAGVTGTAVATGTVGAVTPIPASVTPVPVSRELYVAGGGPFAFSHPQIARNWMRTDLPVALGRVSRTWFWGPGPNTPGLLEQYNNAPAGDRRRLVQYFDKSRMEVNNPQGDVSQPFFVTNGLLSVELIGGFIQTGEADFVRFHPACLPMTGDFGNTTAVTYAAFQSVSNTQAGDHFAPNRVGQPVTATIDARGVIGVDASKANVPGVRVAQYITETQHNMPQIFWDFLNQRGPVVQAPANVGATGTVTDVIRMMANPTVVSDTLISPWFFASGLPISEAYWTRAPINGTVTDVLVQAYERRTLTYVPTNPPGFQVEMGNIGQHYFDWRYRNLGYCVGQPVVTPTPPTPAPVGGGGTPGATGTPGTPAATGTAVGTRTGTPEPNNTPGATRTGTVTGTPRSTETVQPIGTPVPGGTGTATVSPVGTPVP